MSDTRPLHVRVAEALGWTATHLRDAPEAHACGDILITDPERMRWKGRAPGEQLVGPHGCTLIPRYDTDWAAAGPLIERYAISLSFAISEKHEHRFEWIARENDGDCRCVGRFEWDKSPLVAVCRLLVRALPEGLHKCSRDALSARPS